MKHQKYFVVLFLLALLTACAGEKKDASASASVSSASLAGTWINARGTSSWSFDGSGTSGTGSYRTRSVDGKTCDIIYISYSNVNLSSGSFTYYSTGEEWVGAYPVANTNVRSKTYTSSVQVAGGKATIEGESYTKGNRAC